MSEGDETDRALETETGHLKNLSYIIKGISTSISCLSVLVLLKLVPKFSKNHKLPMRGMYLLGIYSRAFEMFQESSEQKYD